MFKQMDSAIEWLRDQIWAPIFLIAFGFSIVPVILILWSHALTIGAIGALTLIMIHGVFGWEKDPKLVIMSILLYSVSWIFYYSWGWEAFLGSAFCLAGILLFFFAPFSRPVLDRLKWPESKVLLRPPV